MNRGTLKKLLAGLVILVVLAPLAFLLASRVPGGPAWGEWDRDEVKARVKYVPRGMERLGNLWKAPLPDYAAEGTAGAGGRSAWYLLSGALGAAVTGGAAWALTRRLTRKR